MTNRLVACAVRLAHTQSEYLNNSIIFEDWRKTMKMIPFGIKVKELKLTIECGILLIVLSCIH